MFPSVSELASLPEASLLFAVDGGTIVGSVASCMLMFERSQTVWINKT